MPRTRRQSGLKLLVGEQDKPLVETMERRLEAARRSWGCAGFAFVAFPAGPASRFTTLDPVDPGLPQFRNPRLAALRHPLPAARVGGGVTFLLCAPSAISDLRWHASLCASHRQSPDLGEQAEEIGLAIFPDDPAVRQMADVGAKRSRSRTDD
jgi:hypothetical protein